MISNLFHDKIENGTVFLKSIFFHFPIKISCCIISNLFHEKNLFGYQCGIIFSFSTNNQVHVHLKTDQVDSKKKPP